ncbi:hypothetical protein DSO57_1024983 [Entomophthora muscae]|uniref:Uncharacterized protein n=1 Tax=Entomophthora muscae TaxID=34485 RepID=A0ACC2SFC1_9FUNG|nr:hypothetical protein DSO57_1024983 [Entomophthora muscae]
MNHIFSLFAFGLVVLSAPHEGEEYGEIDGVKDPDDYPTIPIYTMSSKIHNSKSSFNMADIPEAIIPK